MRLPRDLAGADLARRLERRGYARTRQTGSHLRLTYPGPPEHHVTIPVHESLRVGTLSSILSAVAGNLGVDAESLARELFG